MYQDMEKSRVWEKGEINIIICRIAERYFVYGAILVLTILFPLSKFNDISIYFATPRFCFLKFPISLISY